MKTFKQFIKDKEEEIPAFLISQGEHSKEKPKKKEIPSMMISQGEHSRKKIKEEALAAADKLHDLETETNKHIGSDVEEVHEKLNDAHDFNKLKPEHRGAIKDYTVSSLGVNSELFQAHRNKEKPDSSIRTRVRNTDAALKQFKLPTRLNTYSGVKFDPGKEAENSPDRKIHLPAYTSSSISPNVAHGFSKLSSHPTDSNKVVSHVLRFNLPEGHHGLYVGKHSEHSREKEFIIPRDTTVRIGDKPEVYQHPKNRAEEIHIWDAHPVEKPKAARKPKQPKQLSMDV
jgi:hypothetical protein